MTTLRLPPKTCTCCKLLSYPRPSCPIHGSGITFDMPILNRPTNPYTTEEESAWQRIVGSDTTTPEHIAAFEKATGKTFNHNYLF